MMSRLHPARATIFRAILVALALTIAGIDRAAAEPTQPPDVPQPQPSSVPPQIPAPSNPGLVDFLIYLVKNPS